MCCVWEANISNSKKVLTLRLGGTRSTQPWLVVHCCQLPPRSARIYFTIDWWYIVKIPYSLIYLQCTDTGTDGIFTGIDDTGTGTDSTSTDAYDIGTSLSHFHWWILRLSAIPKKHGLTDWVNNIGLRDASASKNRSHYDDQNHSHQSVPVASFKSQWMQPRILFCGIEVTKLYNGKKERHLHCMMFQTIQTIYIFSVRIWSWQHVKSNVSVNISSVFIAELSPVSVV